MIKRYFVPHKDNNYHPHFFRNAAFGFIGGTSVILLLLSLIGSSVLEKTNLLGAVYSSVLVDLTNQDRAKASLPTLTTNETLVHAAELKAEDMVTKQYFAHNSPEGKSPWYWFIQSGYKFVYAGENLAINFDESLDVENAWMDSPGHRANILNGKFSEVGIAVREGTFEGQNTVFVVQMFGKPVKPIISETVSEIPLADETKTATTTQTSAVVGALPSQEQVAGEHIEVTDQNSDPAGQNIFIAVKDTVAESNLSKNIEVVSESEPKKEAVPPTMYEKLLFRIPSILNIFYIVVGILTIFGLIMLLVVEIKHRKPKLILFAAILLVIVIGAAYLNSTTILAILAKTL
jgi:hypothetical protein